MGLGHPNEMDLTNFPLQIIWGALPSPFSPYIFSASSWAMTLTSYLTHFQLYESFQVTIISSQARLVSNDTSYQYTWILVDMSNSLLSEQHSDYRSTLYSYLVSHLALVGNSSSTRLFYNFQRLQYTLLQWSIKRHIFEVWIATRLIPLQKWANILITIF